MEKWVILIGIILCMIAVVLCYDARKISKKLFSFQETNEVTKILKIVGVVIGIIGGVIIIIGI